MHNILYNGTYINKYSQLHLKHRLKYSGNQVFNDIRLHQLITAAPAMLDAL